MNRALNTIEEAIEAVKAGEVIIVVDDEDRENEGDFLCAAEKITPEIVNFMATHGRGLICAPLVEDRCDELGLDLMVPSNTAAYETPFTVSVDLIGNGCTTGISASDRSKTIEALVDPSTDPKVLGKPGHIFPLRAKKGGVLRRAGHTEAAIDFARLAGFSPAGVIVEIINEDGTMARLPDLYEVADKFNLKLVSIEDLIKYRLEKESLIKKEVEVDIPDGKWGGFKLTAFRQENTDDVHFALSFGEWNEDDEVLVRVHSSSIAQDTFMSIISSHESVFRPSLEHVGKHGQGLILYMNQETKSENFLNILKSYKDNDGDISGVMADSRDYGVGAQILRHMGVKKIKLLTNKPVKRAGIMGYGLEIVDTISLS